MSSDWTIVVPAFTIDNKKLKVLLVDSSNHTAAGGWMLPKTPIGNEECSGMATRNALLKVNIGPPECVFIKQLYTFTERGETLCSRNITTAYIALMPSKVALSVSAENSANFAQWFEVEKTIEQEDTVSRQYAISLSSRSDLPNPQEIIWYRVSEEIIGNAVRTSHEALPEKSTSILAGNCIEIIDMALKELSCHPVSSGHIFHLLPEHFTLSELKHAYEATTGRKVDRSNFRRQVQSWIKPTGTSTLYWGHHTDLYAAIPQLEQPGL